MSDIRGVNDKLNRRARNCGSSAEQTQIPVEIAMLIAVYIMAPIYRPSSSRQLISASDEQLPS